MATNHNDTDSDWEAWGKSNPYWAVLTDERFRTENLDAAARAAFFSSGEDYVAWIFDTMRAKLSPEFAPRRALDFGCGVGRLLLPLALRCDSAVGVDVSENMLREARAACDAKQVQNVSLVKGDDELSQVEGRFDFINSTIVFQHIPCHRGIRLFHRLVALLNDDGFGALQFTYAKGALDLNDGEFQREASWPREDGFWYHLSGLRRAFERRARRVWAKGEASADILRSLQEGTLTGAPGRPAMQMNAYVLNPVLAHLQDSGVRQLHLAFTDHGGTRGTTLFFQKRSNPTYLLPALFERP